MDSSDSDMDGPQATSTQVKEKPKQAAMKSLLQDASKRSKSDYLATILEKASYSELSALKKKIDARGKSESAAKNQGTPLRGILKVSKRQKSDSSDDNDDNDGMNGGGRAMKPEKSTMLKKAETDSDSSSDEGESQNVVRTVQAQINEVKKKPTLQKNKKDDSDSSDSSEEEYKQVKAQKVQNKKDESDSSSDEEQSSRVLTQVKFKQTQNMASIQKLNKDDSDSSSEDGETRPQDNKVQKKPTMQKLAKDDSNSSSEEEEEQKTTKITSPLKKPVIQKPTNDVSDSSSDDEDAHQQEKEAAKKLMLQKLTKDDSDTSSDDEEPQMKSKKITQPQKPTVQRLTKENTDSSDEEEPPAKHPKIAVLQNMQIQKKEIVKKPVRQKDSDSSSDEEENQTKKPSLKVQKKEIPKKSVQQNSDSSSDEDENQTKKSSLKVQKKETPKKPVQQDSDSSSDEEQNQTKKIQKVEYKSVSKNESSNEDSDSSGNVKKQKTPIRKSVNTDGEGKSPAAKKKGKLPDEQKLLTEMESDEVNQNLENFAEMEKLTKAPNNAIDFSNLIIDKDFFFLRVPKKLGVHPLKGLKIALDKSESFSTGNNNYKTTIGKDLNELVILARFGEKYALQKVPLSGCITINEDHPVEILNHSFEADDDVQITIPTEKLKERHPLFGVNYVDKITLDKDIMARLDGMIVDLEKQYKKKKKPKQEENEEIFNILKSHVPNKKEKKNSMMVDDSKIKVESEEVFNALKSPVKIKKEKKKHVENEEILNVLKSPESKKKDRRKSVMIDDSRVNMDNESINTLQTPVKVKKERRKSVVVVDDALINMEVDINSSLGKESKSNAKLNRSLEEVNKSEIKKKKRKSNIEAQTTNTTTIPNDFIESPSKTKKKKKSENDVMKSPKISSLETNTDDTEPESEKKKKKKKSKEHHIINSTMMSPSVERPKFGLEESLISASPLVKKKREKKKITGLVSNHVDITIDEVVRDVSSEKNKSRDHSLEESGAKKIKLS